MDEVEKSAWFTILGVTFGCCIISIAIVVFNFVYMSRRKKVVKEDNKKAVIQNVAIKCSKVYQKYSKDFLTDFLFLGIMTALLTTVVCLLFFVPAMELKLELFGSTVSEREPTFYKMILEATTQLTVVEANSASEALSSLKQDCLFLLVIIPFLAICWVILGGWCWVFEQAYGIFVNKDEYLIKKYRDLKYGLKIKQRARWALNLLEVIAIPLAFAFYGIFRAVFYHAEKDELLEGLGIHMTMTNGMTVAIILAGLCFILGIFTMIRYKGTKQRIMREPKEC